MNKNISWTYNDEFEKRGFFIIKNLCDPSLLYSKVPSEDFKDKLLSYDIRNKSFEISDF